MNISGISKTAANTGMALLAATGIAIGVKCCSNKSDNKIDNAKVEMLTYEGCRTPQEKLLRSVDYCLGNVNPFTSSIIQNQKTHEFFLVLTAKTDKYSIDTLKNYPISNIKINLGLNENVIGFHNNSMEVSGRRNWADDKATVDPGKSIKIPIRELGKNETDETRYNIYELKKNVVTFFNQQTTTFANAKLNFENFINKALNSDKNSLRTTLVGKEGKFYARITRTSNDNQNSYMYSMKYFKNELGLKNFVIANCNPKSSINNQEWNDSAILAPGKYIDVPISEMGQNKDSKENEYLKRACFNIDNF